MNWETMLLLGKPNAMRYRDSKVKSGEFIQSYWVSDATGEVIEDTQIKQWT
jgi:hypothetical protein